MEILHGIEFKEPVCSVEDCDKPIECKSLCNAHYQRFRLYGRTETAVWGQSTHPLYNLWNERKNADNLCNEWLDFKIFLNDVGERPSKKYRLGRFNKKEKYSKINFFWKEYTYRLPGETKKEKDIRRRQERPEVYKAHELKKAFGISLEIYNNKLKEQCFVCAICKQPEKTIHHVTNKLKSLAVDHCHSTNKIRGLLCQRCNRVLGKINDNKELLDKMKAYLISWE